MSNEKNVMQEMLDAQKQAFDTVVENSKKFTNGNSVINETINKGTEWYNNIYDQQKKFFGKTSESAKSTTNNFQEGAQQFNTFFQNWMNQQNNWWKNIWEMNQNQFNANNWANTASQFSNPMNFFQNFTNSWNNGFTSGKDMMNQWAQAFQTNPFQNQFGNISKAFQSYFDMMNSATADWQKSFQTGTLQDTWKNMLNANDNYARFYELWAPMWKSIQEKTFSKELFQNWFNAAAYKEMLDKYFGFVPDQAREYFIQLANMAQSYNQQFGKDSAQAYNQFKGFYNGFPQMNGSEFFGNMVEGYNTWTKFLQDSVSPIAKMATPNDFTKQAEAWSDIANRMSLYQIKNAEMQYMVYTQGAKAIEAIADNLVKKIEEGTTINSMMDLYQEWLKLSDKEFTTLFGSDEYSKIMAETSAMQLRLKKDIELQTEKMLANVPVATRSEMEEVYKTIYDLKKQVRQLEKMLEINSLTETAEDSKLAKKTTKK